MEDYHAINPFTRVRGPPADRTRIHPRPPAPVVAQDGELRHRGARSHRLGRRPQEHQPGERKPLRLRRTPDPAIALIAATIIEAIGAGSMSRPEFAQALDALPARAERVRRGV